MKFQLKPSFVSFKLNTSSLSQRTRLERWMTRKWLDSERRSWFCTKAKQQDLLRRSSNRLSLVLSANEYKKLQESTLQLQRSAHAQMRDKKLKKLQLLTNRKSLDTANSRRIPSQLAPSVINLTQETIPTNEMSLLKKGKKFAVPPSCTKEHLETTLISDLVAGTRNDRRISKDRIKDLITDTISILDNPSSLHSRSYNALKKRLKQKDLVIAKADKGETLVLLNRDDYDRKIKDFLTQSGASPCNLSINSHSDKTRKLIQGANHIITGSRTSRERRFYIMNYSFPKIYGQIKTHKPGHPIRPVVAFYSDPTYYLGGFLANCFNSVSQFQPKHTVKNSAELAKSLSTLKFPANSKLLSFDAVGMFTRIPVHALSP